MKKIILFSSIALLIAFASCTSDQLDTLPTEQGSASGIMDNTSSASVALNGIYRYMYSFGQTTVNGGNGHQCFGPQSYILASDLMGDDMVMSASGNGWFWYDHIFDVKRRYNTGSWRSYDAWNYGYTIISNANYIIAARETMTGTTADVNYVVGQAYALRAYAYQHLANFFCVAYKGNETEPGVPIYTEPTVAGTEGKTRGTLQDLYTQIRDDIDEAIERLDGTTRQHISHMDYSVANAIKARVCLETNEWAEALAAAQAAQTGYTVGEEKDILGGLNDSGLGNVMWAWEIVLSQTTTNPQFFSHMDWQYGMGGYAKLARKKINSELYETMGANDIRRGWWYGNGVEQTWVDTSGNLQPAQVVSYQQNKFRFADPANWMGDRILIRVEEMILIEAEALCMIGGRDGEARTALMKLMEKRDPDYTVTKSGNAMGALTSDLTNSLREEIVRQRRIELWGEFGRLWDIKRLKQGYQRTEAQGFTASAVSTANNHETTNPATYGWIMTIPQAEFDGNEALTSADQNPIGNSK